jgi:uncharacterized protein (DUF58 family)
VYRFRPRYRGVAWTAVGVGGALAATAGALGLVALPLGTGLVGVAMGALYLASPAWRLTVTVDAAGLAVGSRRRQRFHLAWDAIARVVVAPSSDTCFVDGGEPARSLLVPGPGAPAPYEIEDRAGLVAAILARVPADRVTHVESLDAAAAPAVPAPS